MLGARASNDRARAGQGLGGGVGWGLVEAEERTKVDDLLHRELFFDLLGHERDGVRLQLIELVARDGFELSALQLQNHSVLSVLNQQSGEDAALEGGHRGGLVPRADDQAGIKDV